MNILGGRLLVVGGLLALSVACARHPPSESRDTATTQIRMLEMAVDAYSMKYGSYPVRLDQVREFLKGGELPDTPWNGEYFYRRRSSDTNLAYEIWCVAPDGTVAANWKLHRRPGTPDSSVP